VGALVEARH